MILKPNALIPGYYYRGSGGIMSIPHGQGNQPKRFYRIIVQ
jgi:hypothetical protein